MRYTSAIATGGEAATTAVAASGQARRAGARLRLSRLAEASVRAEHFSWWMTSMLHRLPGGDPFDLRLQFSQLRYVVTSHVAAASLAENYVGLEL